MSDPDKKMIEQMRLKIREILLEEKGENKELLPECPEVPIAEILCRHLMFFMSKVIYFMAEHKKMTWASKTIVKKERDPIKGIITTKVVITIDDFYHMMKDNDQLIPPSPVYNSFMKSLESRIVMKDLSAIRRMFEKKVAIERKLISREMRYLKSLKMKEDRDEKDEKQENRT